MSKVLYSGTKIRIDVEIVTQTMLNEAEALVNQLVLEAKMRQLQPGKTERQIVREMFDEIMTGTGIIQPWQNRNNRIVNELVKGLVNRPTQEMAEDKNALFHWVLGSVKTEHCPDCKRMAQISQEDGPLTVDEWRAYGVGLPREGETECSYGCRCMLLQNDEKSAILTDKEKKEPEKIKVEKEEKSGLPGDYDFVKVTKDHKITSNVLDKDDLQELSVSDGKIELLSRYKKAYDIGRSKIGRNMNEMIYGDEIPQWVLLDNECSEFFEIGFRGYGIPEYVTAWRYGDLPRYWSTNFRDDVTEKGVSVMAASNGENIQFGAFEMFNADRPKIDVGGWFNPRKRGSDGEPLILGAHKIEKK